MATHQFDTEIAEIYGVNAAILLNNIAFWVQKNAANDVNFFEGRYWTYNSVSAFSKLFPYLSKSQITTALKKLEGEGIIQTGNFNQSAYDRTTWYAFTDKGEQLLRNGDSENLFSIYKKSEMENKKIENGNIRNEEPIPDNKPYDINSDRKPVKKQKKGYAAIISAYTNNEDFQAAIYAFIEQRKANKCVMTDRALEMLLHKLDGLSSSDDEKIQILNEATINGWKSVYPLKKGSEKDAGNGNIEVPGLHREHVDTYEQDYLAVLDAVDRACTFHSE